MKSKTFFQFYILGDKVHNLKVDTYPEAVKAYQAWYDKLKAGSRFEIIMHFVYHALNEEGKITDERMYFMSSHSDKGPNKMSGGSHYDLVRLKKDIAEGKIHIHPITGLLAA